MAMGADRAAQTCFGVGQRRMSGLGGGAGLGGHGALAPQPDPALVHHVITELKSHGIFDQFRKECIADVDTKPAYQNLRQRVESTVTGFLNHQTWSSDLNKNQLREKLRKHILDSNFLDQGVERIVDQVVNPKIASVFIPQVEEIVYKCFGLEKPDKAAGNSNGATETSLQDDLLPKDLEAVSPESVKSNKSQDNSEDDKKRIIKTELKTEVKRNSDSDVSDSSNEEEFESPAFEPLEADLKDGANSKDSHLSGISDLTSHESNETSSIKPKLEIEGGDSQLSRVSSGSNVFPDSTASASKPGSLKTTFQNTFSNVKNENSTSFPEPMDVDESAYKFNDDNALDAPQYFEETVKDNPGKSNLNIFTNIECEMGKQHSGVGSQPKPESVASKISAEDSKSYTEMAIDSNDANSVFINDDQSGNQKVKEACSFENKIAKITEKPDADNKDTKQEEGSKATEKDNQSSNKDDKHSRKHSRDHKDDSKRHSRSSRHSSSGKNDSQRRHSSSRDKRESRNSQSKSKDKPSSSNNGDSKKDKDRSSSSGNRNSHKSSRDSKHGSEKKDSKEHDKNRDSGKSSKSNGKDRSSHSDSKNDKNSDDSASHKEKSSSKHSGRSSRSSNMDDKKNEKRPSSKDDYCSTSVKTNKPRRSSDRDSNDGSSGINKGPSSNSSNASSAQGAPKAKGSSGGDNSSNGNCSSGQSSDSLQIAGGYIKSGFDMFEYGSMGALKRKSLSEKSPSVKSPLPRFPEKSPVAKFPDASPPSRFPEKSPIPKFPDASPPPRFPEKSPSARFPEKSPKSKFPDASPPSRFPGKSPSAKFPEKSPKSKFPDASPPSRFPGKSLLSRFPGKSPSARFPEKSPKAKFPNASPEKSPIASFSDVLARPPTVTLSRLSLVPVMHKVQLPVETKPGEKSPSPEKLLTKTLQVNLTKLPDYPEITNKKPVVHIDAQLNPTKVVNGLLNTDDLLTMKKPKCAENIYEAMKIMKIRKKMKKMEQKKQQESILLMEQQMNLPTNFSQAFSGVPGPELELACMNSESTVEVNDDSSLKYFNESDNEKWTAALSLLDRQIKRLKTECSHKTILKTPLKNGQKNGKVLKLNLKRVQFLNDRAETQFSDSSQDSAVQIDTNIVISNPSMECDDGMQFEKRFAEPELSFSQEDIMKVILGTGDDFRSAIIHYEDHFTIPIELCDKEWIPSENNLKRKLSSGSIREEEKNDHLSINNNIEENVNRVKRRRNVTKPQFQVPIPGSPESDKSIENHGDGIKKKQVLQNKNSKNGKTPAKLNRSNNILRINAKIK